jgi:hypothetical protein
MAGLSRAALTIPLTLFAAFMMYMTGGGIQIFSVMSVVFLLKGAIQGMFSVEQGKPEPHSSFAHPPSRPLTSPVHPAPRHSAFAPFRTTPKLGQAAPSLLQQKVVYFLCQVGLLCVGLWKCNNMGLLPTHESDWLAFRDPPVFEPQAQVAYPWGSGGMPITGGL